MRHRRALLVALALFAAGCSSRDRSNPFDPGNPATGGTPENFNAIAGFNTVILSWTPRDVPDLQGFYLERLVPGDSLWRPFAGGLVPTFVRTVSDQGARNGQRLQYRIAYQFPTRRSAFATDTATPGSVRPWVAEYGFNRGSALTRVSPDARDVVQRFTGFGGLVSIAVDAATGLVWVSDDIRAEVRPLEPVFANGPRIQTLSDPFTIAVDVSDNSAWVCDLSGSLAHFSPSGNPATPGRIDLLDRPSGVAVNPRDRSVWVVENGGWRARHYDSFGAPIGSGFVRAPSRVAVDSVTKVAWISALSVNLVYRLAENGQLIDSLAVTGGPLGIAVDSRRGRVWVTGVTAGEVVALRRDGSVEFRVRGLSEPRAVAVDPTSGEAWVVAYGTNSVARLSPAGAILDQLGGFASPYDIALDPGTF